MLWFLIAFAVLATIAAVAAARGALGVEWHPDELERRRVLGERFGTHEVRVGDVPTSMALIVVGVFTAVMTFAFLGLPALAGFSMPTLLGTVGTHLPILHALWAVPVAAAACAFVSQRLRFSRVPRVDVVRRSGRVTVCLALLVLSYLAVPVVPSLALTDLPAVLTVGIPLVVLGSGYYIGLVAAIIALVASFCFARRARRLDRVQPS